MRARTAVAAGVLAFAASATDVRAEDRTGQFAIRADREDRGGYDGRDEGHGPGRNVDGRRGPAFRYGFDRGWREGSEEGHKDGRRSRDPRYWREGEFRDADRGYKGWMGPRWDYSSGFRDGYRAGYRRAYASARPSWRGRWERYGWGSAGYGPYGEREARREREERERREEDDWRR